MRLVALTLLIPGLLALFAGERSRTSGAEEATAGETPVPAVAPFPRTGLLPKEEIGALRFLKKQPDADGRGVIVAVFDTGVDPGADGLQTTSDGRPKIVDLIDATGSGDVPMTVVQKPKGQTLQGLSGRTLKLDPQWKNPRGDYRLGIKAGFDLFPAALVSRLKRERKRRFEKTQRRLEAKLQRDIERFQSAHPQPTAAQRRELAELRERLKQLRAYANHPDPGPVFDCVVFHDGNVWRAVVDTDEDGDLTDEKPLTNYRRERQYATFGNGAELNFAANIYDNGRRLSLVVNSGAHGTHVAGIVAACYPAHPERNGIAPGAQIVSVKIGDTRLGSMETGTALMRGLRAVLETKCDLINMSYGEPTEVPDTGALTGLFNQLVREHGVIFVASAGNEGPALSTVGSPGGTTSDVIGVGAYVSPQMMAVEYTLRQKYPGLPFTWSSRGPTADGDAGVDVFAPGAAIAPVPAWTLQHSMQMNGTSMASPNACGAIALLLSAAKANRLPYSPYSVQRALQNTARRIDGADSFAQGPGLIQVDRAWDHLKTHDSRPGELLRYSVQVRGERGETGRGIYVRDPQPSARPQNFRVTLRPVFPKKTPPRKKTAFELRLSLQPTADWIHTGQYAVMTSGGVDFTVKVDPAEPGTARAGAVLIYDADAPQRGPLVRVPVTVIGCEQLTAKTPDGYSTVITASFVPGRVHRRFFAIPPGVTWADLSLDLKTPEGSGRLFVVHTVRAEAGRSIKQTAKRKYVRLPSGKKYRSRFAVSAGETLEVCLAQYWSSLEPSEVTARMTFRGLQPNCETVALSAGHPFALLSVTPAGRKETVSPSAVLKTHRRFVRPRKAELRLLSSPRDRLPNGLPAAALTLTYEFAVPSPGHLTPRFPLLEGLLYDSPVPGVLWMLFDPAKQRIAADDVWPSAIRVGKGRHTLKLQLRHTRLASLEKFKTMPLVLDRPLSRSIALSVYASRVDAAHQRKRFSSRTGSAGEKVRFVLAAPALSQLPATVADGDVLLGSITYGTSSGGDSETGQRPGGFPLRYFVSATGRSRVAQTAASAPAAPSTGSWAQRLRRLKIQELQKRAEAGTNRKAFEQLAAELLKENPDDLEVLVARLKFLDHVRFRKERLADVVEAANEVLRRIDREALARHFGTRIDPEDAAARQQRRKMERLRDILTDTLYRKGRALGYMELPDVIARYPIADPVKHNREFEANFAELRRWVDTTEKRWVLLHVRRERRRGNYGTALRLLSKYIPGSEPNYWYIKKRRDLFEKLGWPHLWEYESRRLMIAFPADFEPF